MLIREDLHPSLDRSLLKATEKRNSLEFGWEMGVCWWPISVVGAVETVIVLP